HGIFVSPDGMAGLGFRRLAIIDLSAEANQPMSSRDGSIHVVFNGEIYNFRGLRAELAARGRAFHTQSDTEVIVRLYEERGAAFVDAIDGMFAIAVWDGRQKRRILTRARAVTKPLLYYSAGRRGGVGTHTTYVFSHPEVPSKVDVAALPPFF